MPRVSLPVTKLTRDGVPPAAEQSGDPANGHACVNSGETIIEVRNAHASALQSVTFVTPGTVDGLAIADRKVDVPAGQARRFGGFPPAVYGSVLNIDVTTADLKLTAYEP
ncbi:hypothetical protein ACGFNU_01905 [Spirillospora sp. NPDC048911]|uniref:hypothetical protein n=1 Tax=Spirillospora sp. NPDC048911 TaxID=3364527 RepID=UPI003723F379